MRRFIYIKIFLFFCCGPYFIFYFVLINLKILLPFSKLIAEGSLKEFVLASAVSTTKFQLDISTKIQLILLIPLRSVVHNGDALFELSEIS